MITGLFGLGFPVAPLVLLPYALLLDVIYRVLSYSRDPRRYGRDAALSWEKLTALVVIPIVGLIATFGTGIGFYLLAAPRHSHTELALIVLTITAVASVELVILAVHDLSAHQRRTDVLPFEADVEPLDGIPKLTEVLREPGSGFLPGVWRTSLNQALADLSRPAEQNRAPGRRTVVAAIWSDWTSRWQWLTVLTFATGWLVAAGVALPWQHHHWPRSGCVLLIMVAVALCQLLLSLWISAVHLQWMYHMYLRHGRRIEVLRDRLGAADAEAVTQTPTSLARLVTHAIWATAAVTTVKIWRTGRRY